MDAKTLCLAALSLGDASGYDVKKLLDEPPFAHFQDTGFGSIYPALNRLAQDGLIEGSERSQERRPDKKVYRLTSAGRQHLAHALMKPPGADRLRSDFLFLLFMSERMPRDRLATLIDDRIAAIDAKLAHMDACAELVVDRGHRFVFELGRTYYRAVRDYLARNRSWLLSEEPADPAELAIG